MLAIRPFNTNNALIFAINLYIFIIRHEDELLLREGKLECTVTSLHCVRLQHSTTILKCIGKISDYKLLYPAVFVNLFMITL